MRGVRGTQVRSVRDTAEKLVARAKGKQAAAKTDQQEAKAAKAVAIEAPGDELASPAISKSNTIGETRTTAKTRTRTETK